MTRYLPEAQLHPTTTRAPDLQPWHETRVVGWSLPRAEVYERVSSTAGWTWCSRTCLGGRRPLPVEWYNMPSTGDPTARYRGPRMFMIHPCRLFCPSYVQPLR